MCRCQISVLIGRLNSGGRIKGIDQTRVRERCTVQQLVAQQLLKVAQKLKWKLNSHKQELKPYYWKRGMNGWVEYQMKSDFFLNGLSLVFFLSQLPFSCSKRQKS